MGKHVLFYTARKGEIMGKFLQKLGKLISGRSMTRSVIVVLAAVVVFVTTYMLILPALTLDRDTAVQQGGIDVPSAFDE